MSVPLRHPGCFVSEDLADNAQVDTLHYEPTCGGVAQRVE
jgi:hypothetical protein